MPEIVRPAVSWAFTFVTVNTYERAGDINPGSMEFDQPTEAEIERRQRLAAA